MLLQKVLEEFFFHCLYSQVATTLFFLPKGIIQKLVVVVPQQQVEK
jgi:hypothetical protein